MYSNNPQAVYNGMQSGYRNMILMSAVAITMIGFVKEKSIVLEISVSFMFLLAAIIGIQSALDYSYYLRNNVMPDSIYRFTHSHTWIYIGFTYAIFLVALGIYTLVVICTTNL